MTGAQWGRMHAAAQDLDDRHYAGIVAARYRARWPQYEIEIRQSGAGKWFIAGRPRAEGRT